MKRWLSLITDSATAATDSVQQVRRGGNRVLIHEILSLQILSTAVIGTLAVAGLYWGGQWVLQDNYNRWALQWTEELNELGAPLYLPDDNEVILRLESFVDKYPEIDKVTYYRRDGSVLFSIDKGVIETLEVTELDRETIDSVSALMGAEAPYYIDSSVLNARAFRILAPIWTEAIAADGLFDFTLAAAPSNTTRRLIGFVDLNLDFNWFHGKLVSNIKIAVSVLLGLLIISGLVGRQSLRRALTAISDLQKPIAELAKGNLSVRFKPAAHREISEIVEALEVTASALSERDAKLLKLANHDALTGLYNRRRFIEELNSELEFLARNKNRGALLFVDLDQFKYVNDTCGYPAGDRLIKQVADQLERSVGEEGIVARFGGDEFAVLASSASRRQAKSLAEMILDDMRQLAHAEGDSVFHIHCSIGITMINAGKDTADDLVAQADIACREAKARGRNRLEFYRVSEHEAEQIAADVGWIRTLREAIDNDAFSLRYQPIVQISSGETTHHEVLLRLRADNGKMISPDAFLPAAVRFGLMAEIDTWVIENSIKALAEYHAGNPELRFSINLSANAFEAENLAAFVGSQLNKYDVPATCVIFEITESLAVRHLSHVEKQIAVLRDLGCEVALDDFGTGYSSFSYIQQLSVDYIKIDGSFIKDLVNKRVDQKMVRLIGEIGREAGMKTIAEYVQSSESLSLLGELGIDYAQGYYIGRPTKFPAMKSMPIPIATKHHRKFWNAKT
jgi:diguanylate cyclase (GGDEF)-like protein